MLKLNDCVRSRKDIVKIKQAKVEDGGGCVGAASAARAERSPCKIPPLKSFLKVS
jgi:hypothetical protein